MTAKEQKKAAAAFAAQWAGKGYEKGECQKYWRALLHDVFGVSNPDDWVDYEVQVSAGFTTKFVDAERVAPVDAERVAPVDALGGSRPLATHDADATGRVPPVGDASEFCGAWPH